jgi:hypothetical protein
VPNGLIAVRAQGSLTIRDFNFISPGSDIDGDGIPDEWEVQIINANPNDAINTLQDVLGTADFDGDGVLNQNDARPVDAGIGALNFIITYPSNNGTVN